MTRDEAYLHVKARRPRANPNPGFWDQLQEFEARCRGEVKKGHTNQQTNAVVFDLEWAKQSNAIYATCRENTELLQNSSLHRCLTEAMTREDQNSLLAVCLDFIWGRGVLDVDLQWLQFICRILEQSDRKVQPGAPSTHAALHTLLSDQESDFWGVWGGEIYDNQVQKVLKKLNLQ